MFGIARSTRRHGPRRGSAAAETRPFARWPVRLRGALLGAALAAAIPLASCGDRPGPGERRGTGTAAVDTTAAGAVSAVDDAGRTVRLARPARRVVSLLPAGSETLVALGAAHLLVGRTRYDTDPLLTHLPSVGGGLDPSLEALVALNPDLVIAWESAGGGSRIRPRLEEMGIAVFSIQTRDTTDIFRNVASLGRLTGRRAAATGLTAAMRAELDAVRREVPARPRPTVLFVVGVDPPMVAGLDNFIAELIQVAGGDPLDIAGPALGLSPQVSLEELVRRQPDVIILPVGADRSMTASRMATEPGWSALRAVREGRVVEVPADLVNRPGPRIGEMARVLRAALHRAGASR